MKMGVVFECDKFQSSKNFAVLENIGPNEALGYTPWNAPVYSPDCNSISAHLYIGMLYTSPAVRDIPAIIVFWSVVTEERILVDPAANIERWD